MMFRDMHSSSRALLAGLVFFLLIVGGSLLYSWHVHRTTDAEVAETQRKMQPIENKNETRTQDTIDTSTVDFKQVGADPETDNAQAMSDDTDATPNDVVPVDLSDTFLPDDFVSAAAPAEKVSVSPFGFGAYPEVPPDFPERFMPIWTWSDDKRAKAGSSEIDFELMHRVLIKLWNQGDRSFIGVKRQDHDGKVYPIYRNVMYVVNWIERRNGAVRLPASFFGQSDEDIKVVDIMRYERIPTGVTFIDAHTEGYDPYQFLGLQ